LVRHSCPCAHVGEVIIDCHDASTAPGHDCTCVDNHAAHTQSCRCW
jgi:hypothetical protein